MDKGRVKDEKTPDNWLFWGRFWLFFGAGLGLFWLRLDQEQRAGTCRAFAQRGHG
jgi:hypothetical protein